MSASGALDPSLETADRQQLLALARAAELAGLADEQSRFAQRLILRVYTLPDASLSPEERAVVRSALKAEIAPRRAACAALAALPSDGCALLPEYCAERDQDLARRAEVWLSLLRNALLLPARSQIEPEVEYLTWVGDLEVMLAERFPDAGHEAAAALAYGEAMPRALAGLAPTHPLRLGLVLNYATCTRELLKDEKSATEMAKRAFDEAISKLDGLDGPIYEQVSALLLRLRDHARADDVH